MLKHPCILNMNIFHPKILDNVRPNENKRRKRACTWFVLGCRLQDTGFQSTILGIFKFSIFKQLVGTTFQYTYTHIHVGAQADFIQQPEFVGSVHSHSLLHQLLVDDPSSGGSDALAQDVVSQALEDMRCVG